MARLPPQKQWGQLKGDFNGSSASGSRAEPAVGLLRTWGSITARSCTPVNDDGACDTASVQANFRDASGGLGRLADRMSIIAEAPPGQLMQKGL